jgi:cytochrome c553
MKALLATAPLSLLMVSSLVAQQPSTSLTQKAPARSPAGNDISWAFQETNGAMTPERPDTPHTVPGSARTYTRVQIDDLLNAPDWFPDEHPPAPRIVLSGHDAAQACGVCHLMSGYGHPESADITGLAKEYFRRTMADFKSGKRLEVNHMTSIARALSDEEVEQAADWYALLKPAPWTQVKEAVTVPATWIPKGRMRFVRPEGGTEPLGERIITVPKDQAGFLTRDPHAGFVAYVPVGSIMKGEALVRTGGDGRTVACSTCHGEHLTGSGIVPRLAGLHPVYIARQLYMFQDGRRNGADSQSMKKSVAKLTDDDIINMSAYLGSLDSTSGSKP